MARNRTLAAFALTLALAPIPSGAGDASSDPAYFVVIENGGVVTDREAAQAVINETLGTLSEMRRRRSARNAQIHIILSASPTETAWSGTPAQLYEQGAAVLEVISFRDSCSDLVLAYEQVALTARITRPSEVRLIGIGPFIHAGYPCDQGDTTITLPQPVDAQIKLAEIAAEATFLRLLNVHADQDQMVLDHLDASGVMARIDAGELEFDLLDPARTRAASGAILGAR